MESSGQGSCEEVSMRIYDRRGQARIYSHIEGLPQEKRETRLRMKDQNGEKCESLEPDKHNVEEQE